MPRLIHLNGPSRVGKTTLARRYVDEHPGALVLDLDLAERRHTIRLDTTGLGEDASYERLLNALTAT